jgi:beta-phosphoglucomutase-like phosphatase (HAD superfamily)
VTVAKLLAERDHILLDVDGPLCALFDGDISAKEMTDRLRALLGSPLPADIETTTDPYDILRYAVSYGPATAHVVEQQMRRYEVRALLSAPATPNADAVVRALYQAGNTVTIVSNLSADAIRSFLILHDLGSSVRRVSARTHPETALKPNPFLIEQAIAAMGTSARYCVLVGSSFADVEAGKAAGTAMIAYSDHVTEFLALGVDAVIEDMAELRA